MYKRPYTIEEIKTHYPDKVKEILNDPIHLWRAETGIELIHKEPSVQEQKRIWENWNEMSDEEKDKSNKKSMKIFNLTNTEHHQKIMREWD